MTMRRLILGAVAAMALAGTARAQCDTRFSLVNQSGVTIQEFYFGSSAQPNWGVDQLGQNVLPSGRSMNFSTRNPGLNDFRVVWSNGERAQLMQVNICVISQIVATPRGIEAR
jgi:hypothetical protein